MKKYAAAIILAGGNSERMNFPKPYLTIGGKTFLERISRKYFEAGVREVYAVINTKFLSDEWKNYFEPLKSFIQIVENKNTEHGKFYSLKLGVEKMNHKESCFVQNVDNPFVSVKLISELWRNKIKEGTVVPVYNSQGGHPVLLSECVIKAIDLSPDQTNLHELLSDFERKNLETDNERILCNINTREDYRRYIMSFEPSEL